MDYTPCWKLENLPTKQRKKYIGKNNTVPKYYSLNQLTLNIKEIDK